MEGHGAGGALPGMQGAGSKVGERGVGGAKCRKPQGASVNLLELIFLYRIDFYEP